MWSSVFPLVVEIDEGFRGFVVLSFEHRAKSRIQGIQCFMFAAK